MANEKIYGMLFNKVFPMLIAKAERKGRKKEEVYEITEWLTGYSEDDIDMALSSEMSYGDFFLNAPTLNPNRKLIKGVICGILAFVAYSICKKRISGLLNHSFEPLDELGTVANKMTNGVLDYSASYR